MAITNTTVSFRSRFLRDYGMLAVLLVLGGLFALLTIREQHPTGAAAGKEIAKQFSEQTGTNKSVLIVARGTSEDRAFSEVASDELQKLGISVLATVNGSPSDVRTAVEKIESSGKRIDVLITNDVTAKWSVYDRFASLENAKRTQPTPYYWPDFLKLSNLLGVANQTAIYAIIAIGMTLVIVSAGIDLSVGSLVALASVSAALCLRDWGGGTDAGIAMVVVSCCLGIAVCAAAGFFNGMMITLFQIPPFIVTLGMMMIASGLAFRLSDGRSISELPAAFLWLGGARTLGVPNPVWLMFALYLIAHVVMSRMVFGRYVYAIGGNEEAAKLSGVPVNRILLAIYTISGALAGLGGVVLTSQLAAGDPKFGLMYELEVIAAVVVGGASLMGGRGKIFGTLIGAFIIAVIKNGMNLTNVDPFNQRIVLGAVLLGAVLLDTVRRRE